MPPAARVGDMHTCPMVTPGTPPVPHTGGPILPMGCPTVLIGSAPAARMGDQALCIGPPDAIAMGSPTVLIGNQFAARIGDPTIHGGVIVMGCPTVMIGETGMGGAPTVLPSRPRSVGQMPSAPKGPLQPGQGLGASGGETSGQSGGPGSPSQAAQQAQPQPTEEERTWIGLLLSDFEGTPLPNYSFRIVLEKGQVLSGRTDSQGLAHFEGVEPDSGRVHFLEIPEERDVSASLEGSSGGEPEPRTYGPITPGTQGPAPEFPEPTPGGRNRTARGDFEDPDVR